MLSQVAVDGSSGLAIITFVRFLGVTLGKWFQTLIPVKFALALNFKLPFLGESRGLLGHCCLFQS